MISALLVSVFVWLSTLTGGGIPTAPHDAPPAAVAPAPAVPQSDDRSHMEGASTPAPAAETVAPDPRFYSETAATDSPMCLPDAPELVPAPPLCWQP